MRRARKSKPPHGLTDGLPLIYIRVGMLHVGPQRKGTAPRRRLNQPGRPKHTTAKRIKIAQPMHADRLCVLDFRLTLLIPNPGAVFVMLCNINKTYR